MPGMEEDCNKEPLGATATRLSSGLTGALGVPWQHLHPGAQESKRSLLLRLSKRQSEAGRQRTDSSSRAPPACREGPARAVTHMGVHGGPRCSSS